MGLPENGRDFCLAGHEDDATSALAFAFSQADNTLASISCDGTVRLWDLRERKEKAWITIHRC